MKKLLALRSFMLTLRHQKLPQNFHLEACNLMGFYSMMSFRYDTLLVVSRQKIHCAYVGSCDVIFWFASLIVVLYAWLDSLFCSNRVKKH